MTGTNARLFLVAVMTAILAPSLASARVVRAPCRDGISRHGPLCVRPTCSEAICDSDGQCDGIEVLSKGVDRGSGLGPDFVVRVERVLEVVPLEAAEARLGDHSPGHPLREA